MIELSNYKLNVYCFYVCIDDFSRNTVVQYLLAGITVCSILFIDVLP